MRKTILVLGILLITISSVVALQYAYLSFGDNSRVVRIASFREIDLDKKANVAEKLDGDLNAQQTEQYEAFLGRSLAFVVSQKCQVFNGAIRKVKSTEGDKFKHVELDINEWLFGDSTDSGNPAQLVFNNVLSAKAPDEYVLKNVRLNLGEELLVARCPQSGGSPMYRLAVSDEKYFPAITEALNLQISQAVETDFQQIPGILSKQNNFVLASYVIQYLSMIGTGGNVDNSALLFAELLGNNIAPKIEWARISGQLDYLLSGENDLTTSTRTIITEKLVKMAAEGDKDAASSAIRILISTSQKEKIDISPFLNKQTRPALLRNYQMYVKDTIPAPQREKFDGRLKEDSP